MKLLITSIALLAASVLSLVFLPTSVTRDVYLHDHYWVLHLHLNCAVFVVLLLAAIVAFLFARFDLVRRFR